MADRFYVTLCRHEHPDFPTVRCDRAKGHEPSRHHMRKWLPGQVRSLIVWGADVHADRRAASKAKTEPAVLTVDVQAPSVLSHSEVRSAALAAAAQSELAEILSRIPASARAA